MSPEQKIEKLAKDVNTFEELSPIQKAVLDIAFLEGRVLIAGPGLAPYLITARFLCKLGLMEREGETNYYTITKRGIELRNLDLDGKEDN